jgi:hypothetical protein
MRRKTARETPSGLRRMVSASVCVIGFPSNLKNFLRTRVLAYGIILGMASEPLFTPRPVDDVIRSCFDELDLRQLAIFARLTPTRRLQMMFELIEFIRQLQYADEQQRDPSATEEQLWERVRRRIELGYDAQTLLRIRTHGHRNA